MSELNLALEVRGVKKSYGQVRALQGVNLQVRPGEVHALLGDNGAGKSTLLKILAGAVTPDEGEIRVNGKTVHFMNPKDAQAAGIETVYQDLALAPTLTPGENVFLGRELMKPGLLGRLGIIDRKSMNEQALEELTGLGAKIQRLDNEVESMSGGQKQAVAVARASLWGTALIMMDEPTAALGVAQTEYVLRLVESLKNDRGLPVLLISHSLPDVFRVADRATVLRLGKDVLTTDIADLSTNDLISAMTGATDIEQGPDDTKEAPADG